MYHFFELDDGESFFYDFYVDVLVELVFVALICKANNAAYNRHAARASRVRSWQWLGLGVLSLFVCVARDAIIILTCDLLMIACTAYILSAYVVMASRDISVAKRRVLQRRSLQERLAAAAPAGAGAAETADDADLRREEEILESLLEDASFQCCPKRFRGKGDDAPDVVDAARAYEATPGLRLLDALRGVLMKRRYAPSYVFREADNRGLHDLVERADDGAEAARPLQRHASAFGGAQVFAAMRSSIRASNELGGAVSAKKGKDVNRARTLTNGIFSGLWVIKDETYGDLTPAQRRAERLERLHLTVDVEAAWEERVRSRSYRNCARLIMAATMGWLLAVAATAALAYLSWVLQNYVERRLRWIERTLDDVDALLATYLKGANGTVVAHAEILEALRARMVDGGGEVGEAVGDIVFDAVDGAVSTVEATAADAVNASVALFNASAITEFFVDASRNDTAAAVEEYQREASRAAADVVADYTAQWYGYVEDYHDVLDGWLHIATNASDNLFFSGVLAAVIAFSLMNYALRRAGNDRWHGPALLMIVARFREMTYRMREHGLIDDMDLIADEAKELEEAQSRSEWFWIRLTAPSAPYAVGFVGMAVSNMLIISCMCFFLTFFITGFTLFPGAARSAGSWIYTQIGSWVVIYPVVYGIDWFYLNSFISVRTYVYHRSCFDLWDFVLGIWKLVTGLFTGVLRVILIYVIATANTIRVDRGGKRARRAQLRKAPISAAFHSFRLISGRAIIPRKRIDWTIFAGRIGWLDIGYNTFASTVMLVDRHNNPTLCAASRLVLSTVPEVYARRACAAHCLTFDAAAPSPPLAAHLATRDLTQLLGDVLLHDDPRGRQLLKRARLGLAWRELHVLWVLVANPSLRPWNVRKWRENPISDTAWRAARAKIVQRKAKEERKRRASAYLEVADRELQAAASPSAGSRRRASAARWQDTAGEAKDAGFFHRRKRRASVVDRIDRLEAVLDDRAAAEPAAPGAGAAAPTRRRRCRTAPRRRRAPRRRGGVAAVARVLTRFQMGHLRTMFRLLDKDQDGLVSVTDLRFHYQSQGCVLSEHEATLVIDAVAVARKGYYVAKGKRGDIREVERTGFDFPELVAFCLWRVASEEPAAVDGGVGSGLRLDASARLAVCETAFVRLKGLDERVVEVSEHVAPPLSFDQFGGAVRRCRLDRGPFGVRSQETRLLFELLCMGHDGGDLRNGVEDRATVFCVHRTRSGHIDLGRGVHVDDGAGFPESPREPARENAFAAARKQGAFKLFHAVSSASSVGSDLGADAPGAPAEEVSVVAADEADGDAPPEASVVLGEAFGGRPSSTGRR
ncbi:hypothetical protein JL721_10366 [Aureococcus anophagefferens]|nr:hypothetical protein JL721_10366 [Aureococcus anophagefferens]